MDVNDNGQGSQDLDQLKDALKSGKSDVLRKFLLSGGDINAELDAGKTPLLFACEHNQQVLVEQIMSCGANLNVKDPKGITPLMFSAINKNKTMAQLFVMLGHPVNEQDNEGKIALMYAILQKDMPIVRLLMSAGSDLELKDATGTSSLIYALNNLNAEDFEQLNLSEDEQKLLDQKKEQIEQAMAMDTVDELNKEEDALTSGSVSELTKDSNDQSSSSEGRKSAETSQKDSKSFGYKEGEQSNHIHGKVSNKDEKSLSKSPSKTKDIPIEDSMLDTRPESTDEGGDTSDYGKTLLEDQKNQAEDLQPEKSSVILKDEGQDEESIKTRMDELSSEIPEIGGELPDLVGGGTNQGDAGTSSQIVRGRKGKAEVEKSNYQTVRGGDILNDETTFIEGEGSDQEKAQIISTKDRAKGLTRGSGSMKIAGSSGMVEEKNEIDQEGHDQDQEEIEETSASNEDIKKSIAQKKKVHQGGMKLTDDEVEELSEKGQEENKSSSGRKEILKQQKSKGKNDLVTKKKTEEEEFEESLKQAFGHEDSSTGTLEEDGESIPDDLENIIEQMPEIDIGGELPDSGGYGGAIEKKDVPRGDEDKFGPSSGAKDESENEVERVSSKESHQGHIQDNIGKIKTVDKTIKDNRGEFKTVDKNIGEDYLRVKGEKQTKEEAIVFENSEEEFEEDEKSQTKVIKNVTERIKTSDFELVSGDENLTEDKKPIQKAEYKGPDINIRNKSGQSLVMIAAAQGKVDQVRLLMDKGANLEFRDIKGNNALMLASSQGYRDVVELLTKKIKHIDFKNSDGHTALTLAVMGNHVDVMNYLIDQEANSRIQVKGMDLLSIAASQGALKCIKSLLLHGFNPLERNFRGKSPYDYAKASGHKKIAAMFARMKKDK